MLISLLYIGVHYMHRQLLILRHGKSDWGFALSDFERPLKKRGKLAAQRLGLWLKQQDLAPDCIFSSPAERAKNTAELLSKTLEFPLHQIQFSKQIYAANLRQLIDVLANCPSTAKRILLIGHNPGLESLLEFLSHPQIPIPEDGKLLPTATLAIFNMPQNWLALNSGCAELISITRPSDISV